MENDDRLMIRLPGGLRQELAMHALRNRMDLSAWVRQALKKQMAADRAAERARLARQSLERELAEGLAAVMKR